MTYGRWLRLTFGLIALATAGPGGPSILIGASAPAPPRVRRTLGYAPAAALAAPDALLDRAEIDPVNAKLAAAGVMMPGAPRSPNPWLPFIAGMAVFIVPRKGLGW